MKAKNLEAMLKDAVEVTDTQIIERIFNKYNRRSKCIPIIVIVCLIIFLLLITSYGKLMGKLYIIICAMIIGIVCTGLSCSVYKLNKKITKIKLNNEPLMCFESKIVTEYDVENLQLDYDSEFGARWIDSSEFYVALNNGVSIEITKGQYKKISNKELTVARVYFYEELLKDNIFELKLDVC